MKQEKKKKNIGGAGDGLFYDEKSKTWGFRIVKNNKDIRRKGFKTKTEAKKARSVFVVEYKEEEEKDETEKTFTEVYEHYVKEGSSDKREGTLAKQGSMWRCHVKAVFGDRLINEVSSGEINNYLGLLYEQGDEYNNNTAGYSYMFVQGVLRFFYLFYGYARRMNWVNREKYAVMCQDVGTKISMPKKQDSEDEDEIETFTEEEIEKMRERIKESALYVPFEIGVYCGLRISETFGLLWEDIDFKNKKLTVRRQLLRSGKEWVLVPCKTVKAVRVIDIPDKLVVVLERAKQAQEVNREELGISWKGVESVRVRLKKGQNDVLTGGDFVNRGFDGSLLTNYSFKRWSKIFKDELNINFKYHVLRHTHASTLAALNVPLPKLMERMGHKKIETTNRYYFGKNEIADKKTIQAINSI